MAYLKERIPKCQPTKLLMKKIGPCRILHKYWNSAYELKLPQGIGIWSLLFELCVKVIKITKIVIKVVMQLFLHYSRSSIVKALFGLKMGRWSCKVNLRDIYIVYHPPRGGWYAMYGFGVANIDFLKWIYAHLASIFPYLIVRWQ